jgi:Holliday junction resolvasome RuvABC ATP-dependent DNA helicase subunit
MSKLSKKINKVETTIGNFKFKTKTQQQKLFFDNTVDRKYPRLPKRPSDDEIRTALSANNSNCPLNDIIVSKKNEGNMRILRRFAFSAYRNKNRKCRGCNFGIYSPPGQGKTFVVKKFAETIGIPFVFVQSPVLENNYMLFEQISNVMEKEGVPLVKLNDEKTDYYLPPCIIFFDEAHELKPKMMKGSLLNAMEPEDAIMMVKMPGTKGEVIKVDCKEVCWIAATTERGDLFDAFETRLTTAIEWHSADEDELVEIVQSGLKRKYENKEIQFCPPRYVCELISKYQKVPRLAIHGFGTKVVQQKSFIPSCSWEECCKIVASDMGLNEFGLTKKQVDILAALGQRPIAEARLADVAKCRVAQVKKYELPTLMNYSGEGPMVVSISSRGMVITKRGLKVLEKMNIPHNGNKITAEYFESKK